MTESMKLVSPMLMNTIVLNGKTIDGSNNFCSLRIEDPKKATLDNDVYLKAMVQNIPQINTYFNIVDKLGEGTFSKVYKAKLKRKWLDENETEHETYALKYLIPIVKPNRIAKELRFLRDLGGHSNIIPIHSCFYHAGHTVFVMPIVEHDKFLDFFQKMSYEEIRVYMRKLFQALDRCHSNDIVHRDIKPSNFLYNRSTKQCALVDFGLSQYRKELCRSANLSMLKTIAGSSEKSTNVCNENETTESRTNLKRKFGTPIEDNVDKSISKRLFNNIVNHEPMDEIRQNNKRTKYEQSSVFTVTPTTPSNSNYRKPEEHVGNHLFHPHNLEQENIGLNEQNNPHYHQVNCDDNYMYQTPTKNNVIWNANKTPVKCWRSIPETPPKTVPKNLYFPTPPTANVHRENGREMFSNNNNIPHTPKAANPRRIFQRFEIIRKTLNPELSTIANQNNNSNKNGHTTESKCECMAKPQICAVCSEKSVLQVQRAGTPGFRAPEILLRSQNQTSKIDIWSCGLILASFLSGRYPFFRCTDDMTCLADIITVIGSFKVKQAAKALGKTLVISPKHVPAMSLKEVCIKLKQSSCENPTAEQMQAAPDSAYDLLEHLLDPNPETRFSASEALSHAFLAQTSGDDQSDGL